MIEVKKVISLAREYSNINSKINDFRLLKRELCKHYARYYFYFVDENRHVPNIEILYYKIIRMLVDSYFDSNFTSDLSTYIKIKLQNIARNGKWDVDSVKVVTRCVGRNINKVKSGNASSKDFLIGRYSYLVDQIVDKSRLNIEYEDALQIGYLSLVEIINDYFDRNISTPLYTYITGRLESKILSYLDEVNVEKSYSSLDDVCDYPDEFCDINFMVELEDFVENNLDKSSFKDLTYNIVEGNSQYDLSKDSGVSRQAINYRKKQLVLKLKKFYDE